VFEPVPAKLKAHPAESKSDEIFVSLTIVLNKIQKYYFIITYAAGKEGPFSL
jgi:hypothetical protein